MEQNLQPTQNDVKLMFKLNDDENFILVMNIEQTHAINLILEDTPILKKHVRIVNTQSGFCVIINNINQLYELCDKFAIHRKTAFNAMVSNNPLFDHKELIRERPSIRTQMKQAHGLHNFMYILSKLSIARCDAILEDYRDRQPGVLLSERIKICDITEQFTTFANGIASRR